MSYTYKDNTDEVLSALERAKKNGLTAIGLTAEGHAKKKLTREVYTGDKPYKLTGRLRNSITYALAGEETHVKSYTANKKKGEKERKTYTYEGTAEGKKGSGVYIGTNVEYAEGIELGTHRKAGPVHFLQDAAANHSDEYKQLMEDSMKNA